MKDNSLKSWVEKLDQLLEDEIQPKLENLDELNEEQIYEAVLRKVSPADRKNDADLVYRETIRARVYNRLASHKKPEDIDGGDDETKPPLFDYKIVKFGYRVVNENPMLLISEAKLREVARKNRREMIKLERKRIGRQTQAANSRLDAEEIRLDTYDNWSKEMPGDYPPAEMEEMYMKKLKQRVNGRSS